MLFDCLCIACMVLGGLVGGAAGCLVARRWLEPPDELRSAEIDPSVADAIDSAARRMAEARGHPMAAPLIADKLRLAYRLGRYQERDDERDERWSA